MADTKSRLQNYILLPLSQMRETGANSPITADFLASLSGHVRSSGTVGLNTLHSRFSASPRVDIKVIDSIHENGAKLVRIDNQQMANLRSTVPGLRIIPEMFYQRAIIPRMAVKPVMKRAGAAVTKGIEVKILSGNNKPVQKATVVAFSNFKKLEGAEGTTNKNGVAVLNIKAKEFERVYVYPEHSVWPLMDKRVKVAGNSLTFNLTDIDLSFVDSLRYFYKSAQPDIDSSVKIGVIDTGVGPHKDINLAGGANTITGENAADFGDNGEGHGTHVAGIIGAKGKIKGVAGGVKIMSYRVFPVGKDASNFYIMKAIDKAVADGCDIINMSLGQQEGYDEGVTSSIQDAYSRGTLCIIAAGNGNRNKVCFPAIIDSAFAISAMGRKGTYPASSEPKGAEAQPYGTDKKNYIADFSNIGSEIDFTGPGVGIISTFPGDRYAVMSGTSMACPAVVGIAAKLLSDEKNILKMNRDQKRTEAMKKCLSGKAELMGFGAVYEGMGMIK